MRRSKPAIDAAPDEQEKAVRTAALQLLARREHSSQELRRKLITKGHDPALVEGVVAALATRRLVSDERFLSSFLRHHASRGQGPMRIRAELRQHGLPDAEVTQALRDVEWDWVAQARQVRFRKFGTSLPNTAAARAKQARFLQYRGFTSDQIRSALAGSAGEAGTDLDIGFDLDSES